jgi:Arc/MetJ-type ribon-helix-helix transcriptional regulator
MSSKVAPEDEAVIAELMEIGEYDDSTQVIHEALMARLQQVKHDRLRELIQEGLDDAEAGRVVAWTPSLMEEIRERAKEKARSGAPIPWHVRP